MGLRLWSNTISNLIPVESAGSFGDGRCCHPSGYLQIALGLLTRSLQARLALSGPAIAGSIQAFPKALYCLAHHQKSLRQFHQTNHGNGIKGNADCSFYHNAECPAGHESKSLGCDAEVCRRQPTRVDQLCRKKDPSIACKAVRRTMLVGTRSAKEAAKDRQRTD